MGTIWRTGLGTGPKFGTGPNFWTAGPVRTGPSAIPGVAQSQERGKNPDFFADIIFE